jgi:hypothetical protein
MYSHGNHVAELQLLDNAICVHRDYTEAKSRVTAFPDGTNPRCCAPKPGLVHRD